jgi:hypothetical protein
MNGITTLRGISKLCTSSTNWLVALSVALGGIAGSARAATPFSRMLQRLGTSAPVAEATAKAKAHAAALAGKKHDGCANFSGTWAGTCTDAGGDWTEEMTIEQDDCDTLYMGGTQAPIGGHFAESITQAGGFVGTNSIFPYWNPNRTVLKVRDSASFRLVGMELFMWGNTDGAFFLMDGKLVYRSDGEWRTETNGTLSVNETWMECSYSQRPQG